MKNNTRKLDILSLFVYALIIILPLILFSPVLLGGKALYWGTPSLQFIPWRAYAWEKISNGLLPLWNDLNGMGAPLLANYQLAFFYPPGWILFLFMAVGGTGWMAWAHTLLVALHLSWAGIGTALLLRRMGRGILAQGVGAISLSLSVFFVARGSFFSIVWVGAWLPWIVFCADNARSPLGGNGRVNNAYVGLVTAIWMMLLAGHAQISWYILLFAFSWSSFRGWQNGGIKKALKSAGWFSLACIFGALLSSVQLLPTLEYLINSQRSSMVDYEVAMTYSFWPWRFLTFFAPNIFGSPATGDYWGFASYWEDAVYLGILPLIFAFSTLSFLRAKKEDGYKLKIKQEVIILWIIILAGVILALGKNTPVFPFLYKNILTFNMFQAPARYMIWVVFCLALLAGTGVDFWKPAQGKALYWLRLGTVGMFAISLGAFLATYFAHELQTTFIYASVLAGLWGLGTGILGLTIPAMNSKRTTIWSMAVLLWLAVDLLCCGWKLNPGVERSFYTSQSPDNQILKKELVGKRVFLSSEDEYFLKFEVYFRFQDFISGKEILTLRESLLPNLNILTDIASANNFDPIVPARYSVWMDFLNSFNPDERIALLQMMNVGVWEKVDYTSSSGVRFQPVSDGSRLFLSECVIFVIDSKEALGKITEQVRNSKFEYLKNAVVEDRQRAGNKACVQSQSSQLDWLKDNSENMIIKVSGVEKAWLILADTWYPGWIATVDGKSSSIYHANFLFRGIEVPAGEHLIEFSYKPIWFRIGFLLSLIFLLGFMGIICISNRDYLKMHAHRRA